MAHSPPVGFQDCAINDEHTPQTQVVDTITANADAHSGVTPFHVRTQVKDVKSARYVRLKDDTAWPPRFVKLQLSLDDGSQIAISDGRR